MVHFLRALDWQRAQGTTPMARLEIGEVTRAEEDPRLRGWHLDRPRSGDVTDGRSLKLVGWALGQASPVVAVAVLHAETVIRRAPLGVERPELAVAFPDVPGADRAGFRVTVPVLGTKMVRELAVQAVLANQQRVPLGVLQVQQRWRSGEGEDAGAALVSVVIPCYNQAHFLGEAIESVLAQTYPHLEIVVVDDGSADNTEAVAARYPGVGYVRQDNQGLSAARNTGLRHSTGSYLVFLDADDRLVPQAVQVGLEHLQAHPECAFVSGTMNMVASDGALLQGPAPFLPGIDPYAELLRDNRVSGIMAVMFRREVFADVGVFDPSLKASEDYDMYLRIARQYPICGHESVVAEYRWHGANVSGNATLMLRWTITVLRRQWPYVRGDADRTAAYWAGLRFWRLFYGRQSVEELRGYIYRREWGPVLRGVRTLLRYHPRGLRNIRSW
jgi:glycosyltransferase involved in cell wall biosynthesis